MPDRFDAISIGSGLGGLTAAALFARAGNRVLVLERHTQPGGAATVYTHAGLDIEASLHEMDGLHAADAKLPVLRALGLDRELEFVEIGDLHEVRSRLLGGPFVLPRGLDAARADTHARFPAHAKGIDGYFDRIGAIHDSIALMEAHQDDRAWWLWNAPTLPWKLWPLIRDRRSTLAGLFGRLFGDDEAIKVAMAPNLFYYTDDPATLPFVSFAIPQASFLIGGGHYIRGGSRQLSGRLVAIIEAAGGSVLCGRTAETILLSAGAVTGVRHRGADGEVAEAQAPVVFGNAAPAVLADMLPEAARGAFNGRYALRRPSISLWTMALGLDRPSRAFGVRRYTTTVLPDWHEGLHDWPHSASLMAEDPAARLPAYSFVAYDRIDSGLNREGPWLASLSGVDRLANWTGLSWQERQDRKARWMDVLIADLDRQYPGIGSAVIHREMATAATMHRVLNTPRGEVYGFAPDFVSAAPSPATTVPGLFLASAYTMSGGFTGAMLGGAMAARAAAEGQAA